MDLPDMLLSLHRFDEVEALYRRALMILRPMKNPTDTRFFT